MEKMTTEEILWKSISDIENGDVSTIEEDPIDGYLKGNNKKLTKINISYQSAKYTINGKPISRPTIDKYENILSYLDSKIDIRIDYEKKINELEAKNKLLETKNKELNEKITKFAEENFRLKIKYPK